MPVPENGEHNYVAFRGARNRILLAPKNMSPKIKQKLPPKIYSRFTKNCCRGHALSDLQLMYFKWILIGKLLLRAIEFLSCSSVSSCAKYGGDCRFPRALSRGGGGGAAGRRGGGGAKLEKRLPRHIAASPAHEYPTLPWRICPRPMYACKLHPFKSHEYIAKRTYAAVARRMNLTMLLNFTRDADHYKCVAITNVSQHKQRTARIHT